MSGVALPSSMAPTPQDFTIPPTITAPTLQEFTVSTPAQGLERVMDWETLDSRLHQVQAQQENNNVGADRQLTKEASAHLEEEKEKEKEQADIRRVEEQLSREASEYPEARTPSSTATIRRFRSLTRSPSVRSRSTPAGKESFQEAMEELLREQESKIDRSMEMLEAATEDNRRGASMHKGKGCQSALPGRAGSERHFQRLDTRTEKAMVQAKPPHREFQER